MHPNIMRWGLTILLFFAWTASAQTADEIVKRSLTLDQRDWERARQYTYHENVTSDDGSKTFDVGYFYGSPYRRLIAKDGKPLPENEARKQQEKMDKELESRRRNPEREQREFEQRRAEMRKMLDEIPKAFTFTIAGEDAVSGKPAWILDAQPKPGYQGRDSRTKLLSKMKARIWVVKNDYRWAKADIEALDTLSFGWFLFRINKGSRLQFAAQRINEEIWLPATFRLQAEARVALLKKINPDIRIAWSNYKKFQTESRVIATDAQ
jgi:hypothetical protein